MFNDEEPLFCKSLKKFSHDTYKGFKKILKKKSKFLITLIKNLDKLFPLGLFYKDLLVVNKMT